MKKAFEYENNFYHFCDNSRISKILAQYELFKMSNTVAGDIIECGVFKGTSLIRFATFRELLGTAFAKKIIAFDIFGKFPKAKFAADIEYIKRIDIPDNNVSITKKELEKLLKRKGLGKNIELVKGDIIKTVKKYVSTHPELKISLLNLDVDLYEPSKIILECLYPKITKGGILILDDYGFWPGETNAAEEYFEKKNIKFKKLPFCNTPVYVKKK